MKNDIASMISALDLAALATQVQTGKIVPRDYQWLAYSLTKNVIKHYPGPSYVTASVGAGKTIMIGMTAKRFQEIGWEGMVLARQGELADQDADECWNLECKNSLFSASLGKRSTYFPLIIGTEGTIANAINKELVNNIPRFLLIDECHQVDWEDVVSDHPITQYAQIINEFQRRCLAKYNIELRIIGYTGSPFRMTTSIKGPFWKHEIVNISTEYLVARGYLVPTIFGYPSPDEEYHLDDFSADGVDGVADFTSAQLAAMQAEILSQATTTQHIMLKVVELTRSRNGVLITCAGKRHCEEAAQYLPDGSYAIVTDKTGIKERRKSLKNAYAGKIKYVLQIGCLTTGVNIPFWDTSVLLRKIMSLTLLTQLLGRGMRLLKDEQISTGLEKNDHLVLDYTGTMFELGQLYHNPILEAAELARAKKDQDTIPCPKCNTENSAHARRCIGEDKSSEDNRCEYFFSSRVCPECHTENDPCARFCRKCDFMLIDPNDNLDPRHYTENDWVNVESFNIRPTRDGDGILYEYGINFEDKPYIAREVFYPSSDNVGMRNAWKVKGIFPHVKDPTVKRKMISLKNIESLISLKNNIQCPRRITHRVNPKGRDIIHRKDFTSEESQE